VVAAGSAAATVLALPTGPEVEAAESAAAIDPEGAAVASAAVIGPLGPIGPVEVATWPASAAATDRA